MLMTATTVAHRFLYLGETKKCTVKASAEETKQKQNSETHKWAK